ncbi:MAG TPA: UDP-N-acetylmuramate--L-alanine ligase [Gemmatimonadales bacterium]|jgi:UDP-N-acetylmuramate--alanine ligase|nr:UDP-N-acetylmuramate--L-alanine ligase [Gemmatimonadales bacterium]
MNLFLPSDRRPLHFVGIGGAGMGALALIALRRGVPVSGSDSDISGCGDLVAAGARVFAGHAADQVGHARAVVASAAIPADHVEVMEARSRAIPVFTRKEALAGLIGEARCIGIAGTHGKTTTTVMATEAVAAAGIPVTGIAGGRVSAWGGNARLGGDDLYVVEADEYDQAFLTLRPTIAVVNNVEADHLECYGSLEALEGAFVTFAGRSERALVGNDSAGAERVARRLPAERTWRFGPGAVDLDLRAIETTADGSRATVSLPGRGSASLRLRVPGEHNLRNATAALGVVVALGGDPERALEALAEFRGVGRRFERLGEFGGIAIVDDYAHHPTELRVTLAAARQAYPGRRLVATFQPHLYSRTAQHADAMGEALAAADLAVITDVYGAREAPLPGVTGELVARAARLKGGAVVYLPSRGELGGQVAALLRPGDVLLTLGAGDITRLGSEVREHLESA